MTTLDMHFKDDLANILRGIAVAGNIGECSQDFQDGFDAALLAMAQALGIVDIELRRMPRQPRAVNAAQPAETSRSPQTMQAHDPGRYRETGRVSEYGERECYDVRTGRLGVITSTCGFEPGARIAKDGRLVYDDPNDNPLRGLAGCF